MLQPVGDVASKEGVNRAERGGKDESGSYGGPAASVTDPIANNAQSAGSGIMNSAKGAGSYVGSFFGGSKDGEKK